MDTKKIDKLINKAHRYAALAYNAHTRAMQSAGFDSGRKAAQLADQYWEKFEATIVELQTALDIEDRT